MNWISKHENRTKIFRFIRKVESFLNIRDSIWDSRFKPLLFNSPLILTRIFKLFLTILSQILTFLWEFLTFWSYCQNVRNRADQANYRIGIQKKSSEERSIYTWCLKIIATCPPPRFRKIFICPCRPSLLNFTKKRKAVIHLTPPRNPLDHGCQ